MIRIDFALRAGASLRRHRDRRDSGAGAKHASARPMPPRRLPTAAEPPAVRRHRRHRLAHPPRPADQDAPVVFVDQEDIAKTGLNSINDVLQRLPSSGGGLNSKFNNCGNFGNPPDGGGVGAGAAEVDLRYLGSKRTLVLVDGLRFVNGASASGVPGSVDLNAIPESMIERVEVLQDGASAIYGSDAIAGVVNIITKRSQEGFLAIGPARRLRRGRRLHPELPAQLGQWRRRPDADRRRRQLREAGLDQLGRPRHLAIPDARRRPPATTPAARARRNGRFIVLRPGSRR